MGKIGEVLPKPLWPIFEKKILELQIRYVMSLGIRSIFINLFYQKELFINFLRDSNLLQYVTILDEPELLGVGGGIHNLARHERVNYKGSLFLLSSDQFLMLPSSYFAEGIEHLTEGARAFLFLTEIKNDKTYSETVLDAEDRLIDIVPKDKIIHNHSYLTYSATGLVSLDNLKPVSGVSSFFETVARFRDEKVIGKKIDESVEYWDFGTIARFYHSTKRLVSFYNTGRQDRFLDFLLNENAILPDKIGQDSYGSDLRGVFNFGKGSIARKENTDGDIVVLDGSQAISLPGKTIWGVGVEDQIN